MRAHSQKGFPNARLRRERELRGWSQEKVAEEVGTTQKIVSRWERGESIPVPYYRERLVALFGKNAEELGLIVKQDSIETPPVQRGVISAHNSDDSTDAQYTQEKRVITDNETSNMPGQECSSQIEDTVNRRDFNRKALRVATAAFVAPDDLLNSELLDRFSKALKKSFIDKRFLGYLETRTESYWRDRQSASLASSDLLSYVIEHFEKILALFEGSLLPTERMHLCSLASKTALLIGELLLDMGYYARAREFQKSAITSAQEANNQALQAICWGRLSLAWIYSSNIQNALICVQEARSIATR